MWAVYWLYEFVANASRHAHPSSDHICSTAHAFREGWLHTTKYFLRSLISNLLSSPRIDWYKDNLAFLHNDFFKRMEKRIELALTRARLSITQAVHVTVDGQKFILVIKVSLCFFFFFCRGGHTRSAKSSSFISQAGQITVCHTTLQAC